MPDPAAEPTLGQRLWLLIVLSTAVSVVMIAFATFFSASVDIARDTGASQTQVTWMVDVFTLTMSAFLMPAGALGDRFGRRGVMNLGLTLFVCAAVLGLVADDTSELIAVRAFEGSAAALIMPSTLSLITTVFPPKYRPRAVAVWSAVMIFSAFVGVLGTATLLEFFAWESAQQVTLGLAIVACVLGWTIPTSKERAPPRFDGLGALLSALVCGGAVYGMIQGGESSWGDPKVVASLTVAALAAVAFVLVELRVPDPLLDVRVFRIRPFAVGTLVVGASYAATWAVFFLTLLYMQYVKGLSVFEAAMMTGTVLTLGILPMVLVADRLVARWGLRTVLAVGVLIDGIGFLALATTEAGTDQYVTAGYLIIMGIGIGTTMAPASSAILEHLPENKQGVGSAVNHASRDVAIAFSLALTGSLLSSGYSDTIGPATEALPEPAREVSRESIAGALAVAEQSGPAGAPLVAAAEQAFVDGMQAALLVTGVSMILVAAFVAVWTPARRSAAAEPRGVRGTVRTTVGVPVPDARVVLIEANGRQVARADADRTGSFVVEAPGHGQYTLVCIAAGQPPAASPVSLNGSLRSRDITLGLDGQPASWTARLAPLIDERDG